MTIQEAQEQVDQWIKTVGVRYFNELTNMAMLTEEVGEVARIIARRYGEQSEKESDKQKDLGNYRDWGGLLPKCNGGVRRYARYGRTSC